MRRVMVRYKVKSDRAADNERYIKAVFAQLDRDKPDGIRYATVRVAGRLQRTRCRHREHAASDSALSWSDAPPEIKRAPDLCGPAQAPELAVQGRDCFCWRLLCSVITNPVSSVRRSLQCSSRVI